MNQTEQHPLAGRPRRRSWIDILLLQPLSSNPQMALVLTRRGRVFGVIPAGSTHVLSDYIDWPCDIIEVDGRQRRLALDLALESRDSGRYFHAVLQLAYVVVRPERVALEIDDVLGELERTIIAAVQATARPLTIDQPAILKASIQELMQQNGSLAVRIAGLGLAVRQADITIDIAPADREFAERIQHFHREHSFAYRIIVESLDPRISFEVQVAGAYRYRSRAMLNSGPDEAEFSIREIITKSICRVGIEFAPHEYREAAHAIAEALHTNPILTAELVAAELELLRPVVDIHPSRPMLTVAMQTRLLPAPANDETDPFERIFPAPAMLPQNMLPTLEPSPTPATSALITPLIPPTPIYAAADLWSDDETISAPQPASQPPAAFTDEPTAAASTKWSVDAGLFSAASLPEPSLPSWLQHMDSDQDQDQDEPGEELIEAEEALYWSEEEPFTSEQHIAPTEPAVPSTAAISTNSAAAALSPMPTVVQASAPQIARWIQLLRSDGEEEFERLALVIIEQPDRLSAVLNGLIRDPAFLQEADNPSYQQDLAAELEHYVARPTPPDWLAEAPTESLDGAGDLDQRTLPEWLQVG